VKEDRLKQNALFRSGPNTRLNAEIHKYRGLASFLKYAQGYFHAANELVFALENDNSRMDPHLCILSRFSTGMA
jgi:hypothetical protein